MANVRPNPYDFDVTKMFGDFRFQPFDVEAAWAAEVERRHAEMESGAVSLLPGAETLARLKAEFQ